MPTEEQLQESSTFKKSIHQNKRPQIWRPPTIYNPNKPSEFAALQALLDTGRYETVQELEMWATDISEILEPSDHRGAERAAIYAGVIAQDDYFGRWVANHHEQTITQIANPKMFRRVRTGRNYPLITPREQARLADLHIVTIGQSVGSSATIACVLAGIGGIHTIVDFDRLSWSNLNRIPVGISEAGANKVVVTANRIAGINPYIEQHHYYDGATDETLAKIFAFIRSLDPRKTIIIEAIDGIPWKYEIRRLAKLLGIAIVMPTDLGWGGGDAVQVERHDSESGCEFFADRLGEEDLRVLATKRPLTRREKGGYALKIIGKVPRRMAVGMLEIGNSTTGITQLGSTAGMIGGSAAVAAIFRIACDYPLTSGWYSAGQLARLNDAL